MTYPPISDNQLTMLQGLSEGRRPIAISEELGVTKQRGTGLIDALVSRGLVERVGEAPWITYTVTPAGTTELGRA